MLTIVLRQARGSTAASWAAETWPSTHFATFKPDVVLLDLMLPGMDGIDVCRQIRAESGVPIVMLTAKGDTIDVVVGLESGADDYIIKPFKPKRARSRGSGPALRRHDVTNDEAPDDRRRRPRRRPATP